MDNQRIVWRVGDVCSNCQVGRTTVYAEMVSGRLSGFKIGRARYFLRDDVMAWLEGHRKNGRQS